MASIRTGQIAVFPAEGGGESLRRWCASRNHCLVTAATIPARLTFEFGERLGGAVIEWFDEHRHARRALLVQALRRHEPVMPLAGWCACESPQLERLARCAGVTLWVVGVEGLSLLDRVFTPGHGGHGGRLSIHGNSSMQTPVRPVSGGDAKQIRAPWWGQDQPISLTTGGKS